VNQLTDTILGTFLAESKLVEYLKEVVPPLGLGLLGKLNEAFTSGEQQEEVVFDLPEVQCLSCNQSILNTWASIWDHLKYAHDKTQRSKNWTCPFCQSNFMWFNAFKTHVQSQHDSSSVPCVSHSQFQSNCVPGDPDEPSQGDEHQSGFHLEEGLKKIRLDASKFMIKLTSTGRLALSQSQWVIDSTKELLTGIIEYIQILTAETISETEFSSVLTQLKNPFSQVDIEQKMELFLTRVGFLIKPEEITLGSHFKTLHKHNQLSSQLVFDTMQYVSIGETLKRVLVMPGVVESVLSVKPDEDENLYSNAMSGAYLKKRFQKCNSPNIFILFYFDELEVCNPLGSRSSCASVGTVLLYNSKYLRSLQCQTGKYLPLLCNQVSSTKGIRNRQGLKKTN